MTEKKFNIGDKVMYKGCLCIIQGAHYTHFYNGAWWMYDLDNGSFIASVAEMLRRKTLSLQLYHPPKKSPLEQKRIAKNERNRLGYGKLQTKKEKSQGQETCADFQKDSNRSQGFRAT